MFTKFDLNNSVCNRRIEGVQSVFPEKAIKQALKERWQVAINKVRAWQLTEYTKILFFDLDSLVLKNLDFLLNYPELTASNDQAEEVLIDTYKILNPGIMVLKPSNETFNRFIKYCNDLPPDSKALSTAEQGQYYSFSKFSSHNSKKQQQQSKTMPV